MTSSHIHINERGSNPAVSSAVSAGSSSSSISKAQPKITATTPATIKPTVIPRKSACIGLCGDPLCSRFVIAIASGATSEYETSVKTGHKITGLSEHWLTTFSGVVFLSSGVATACTSVSLSILSSSPTRCACDNDLATAMRRFPLKQPTRQHGKKSARINKSLATSHPVDSNTCSRQ